MQLIKIAIALLSLLLVGCTQLTLLPMAPSSAAPVSFLVTETPLNNPATPCEDRFVSHDLDHITSIRGDTVHLYDSNGSGLAINDLDNDGDLDLVLGNLAGPNAIFWNEGGLSFSKQELPIGQTRAVNIIDFDGDGWPDIFFARQQKRPTLWRNLGLQNGETRPTFEEVPRPGIWVKAFTSSWADLDVDGDLDLVAASYDTEYTRGNPGAAGGGGVALFQNQGDGRGYESTSLAFETQALALMLEDINGDGATDILVGNDFFLQDLVWLQRDGEWQKMDPFATMSMNTMSYASGDLDNDGLPELFAGDMLPYQPTDEILAQWAPVVQHIEMIPNDPQIMANVVHKFDPNSNDGQPTDQAPLLGIKAAGWSWSAQFGDLNNDGLLDLYIVNGMNAEELFGHLPGNELVEENMAFRNTTDGRFVPAPEWVLNSTLGGRSMSMADLDQDGDLDIVVNNLLGPTQLFENRLCGGSSLLVDLHQPDSKNRRAIGAKLALVTAGGIYYRTVHAASGYLSGVPAQLHFGYPEGSQLERLEVTWPDGEVTVVKELTPNTTLAIRR